jgi:hypothetical protein
MGKTLSQRLDESGLFGDEGVMKFGGEGAEDWTDAAFVGYATRCGQPTLLAYDYDALVAAHMRENSSGGGGDACDKDYDDAVDHVEFNVAGAWMGEKTPILLHKLPGRGGPAGLDPIDEYIEDMGAPAHPAAGWPAPVRDMIRDAEALMGELKAGADHKALADAMSELRDSVLRVKAEEPPKPSCRRAGQATADHAEELVPKLVAAFKPYMGRVVDEVLVDSMAYDTENVLHAGADEYPPWVIRWVMRKIKGTANSHRILQVRNGAGGWVDVPTEEQDK